MSENTSLWPETLPSTGLPTPKLEDWKYTSLAALRNIPTDEVFSPRKSVSFGETIRYRAGQWSLPNLQGIEFTLSNELRIKHIADPLELWNEQCNETTLHIRVTKAFTNERPLQMDYESEGLRSHPRVVLHLEPETTLSWFEDFLANTPHWFAPLLEVRLGKNAELRHVRLTDMHPGAAQTGSLYLHLDENSRYFGHSIATRGRVTRSAFRAKLSSASHFQLHGIAIANGSSLHDHFAHIEHEGVHASSRQEFCSVANHSAQAVVSSRVRVDPHASHADSKQSLKSLLRSPNASVQGRPQLEIETDEVQCAHGATVGHLDEEAMFYLQSRGIPKKQAEEMLSYAFVASALSPSPLPQVAEEIISLAQLRLEESF